MGVYFPRKGAMELGSREGRGPRLGGNIGIAAKPVFIIAPVIGVRREGEIRKEVIDEKKKKGSRVPGKVRN